MSTKVTKIILIIAIILFVVNMIIGHWTAAIFSAIGALCCTASLLL